MAEKTLNFHKLSDCVINQLKRQNYMDSTLMIYRRIYNRIYSLMKKLGTETYTPEIGRQFLDSVNVCRSIDTNHISYSFIKNSIAAVAEEIGSAGFNTKLNEERNKGAFVMSPHAGDIERLLSKSSKLAGEVRDEKA